MGLETNVQGIQDLNETWPLNTDLLPEANEHLQNLKLALHGSFPHMAANGGIVTVTAAELNSLTGVTGNVQTQLDAKPDSVVWTRPVFDSSSGSETTYILTPNVRAIVERNAGDTLLTVTLPTIAESNDGDILEIKAVDLVYESLGFQLVAPGVDQMYALDVDGTWRTTQIVVVDPTQAWPHIQCSYQTAFSAWVVRVLDNPVLLL